MFAIMHPGDAHMRIGSLEVFGIAPALLASLEARYGPELRPVQERAVEEFGLLRGESLLAFAPTSAGKTLLAELAALRAASRGRKAILALPTRALVEEKAAHFEEAYGAAGLRVVAGTRDHREHDHALRGREFDLAVVVYEKLASLLVSQPSYLEEVEVVALDELQLLCDPRRGWEIQWILRALRERAGRAWGEAIQIIGLSAALSEARGFAEWMGLPLLLETRRPLPLHLGVLHAGVLHYRDEVDSSWGRETLVPDQPAEWDWLESDERRRAEMLEVARVLIDQGERVLCFLSSKADCHRIAYLLREDAPGPPAERALARLAALPRSVAAERLAELLASGIAFHHSDLLPELRILVEQAAREGELRALCATSTLAMGVNVPVDTVLIDPRRWHTLEGTWSTAGISHYEFEAMAGRAGRLGAGTTRAFGRALLCCATPIERDALLAEHIAIRQGRAPLRRDAEGLSLWLLRLACEQGGLAREAALETLTGDGAVWEQPDAATVEEALAMLRACGGLAGEALAPTGPGRAAATLGLEPRALRPLAVWAEEVDEDLGTIPLLASLCRLRPLLGYPIPRLGARDAEAGRYLRALALRTLEIDEALEAPPEGDARDDEAARRTLLLLDWLADEPTAVVERRYRVLAGAMRGFAHEAGRVAEAAASLLRELRPEAEALTERLCDLSLALSRAVPESVAGLASLAPHGTPRDALLALREAGLTDADDVARCTPAELGQWVPEWLAAPLLRRARAVVRARERARLALVWSDADWETRPERPARTAEPTLCLHLRRPQEVRFRGHTVAITEKQFELLRALVERPGQYVTFDELYEAMWNEGLEAQPAQIAYHKRLLLERLAREAGEEAVRDLICSVRGRGLMLNLEASEVVLAGEPVAA